MVTRLAVRNFLRFYDNALAHPQKVSLEDMHTALQRRNVLFKDLEKGALSKASFLEEQRNIDSSIHWMERQFFVGSSHVLEACIFALCEDGAFAKEQRLHEEMHARDIDNFLRLGHCGQIYYSLYVTSDGYATPFIGVYNTLWWLAPLKLLMLGKLALLLSIKIDPYSLAKQWSVAEYVALMHHLQAQTRLEDRSFGDQIVLS